MALDALYEAEIRDRLPIETFESHQGGSRVVPTGEDLGPAGQEPEDPVISEEASSYARTIVTGVEEHQAEIDELIHRCADRWAIERMPIVDRTLLRIAVFELLWGSAVPVAVVINEAVEMAKGLSTDDSGRFINGLLGRIADERPEKTTPSAQ